MGSVYFPQLSSGAIAQYSMTKQQSTRTVRNVMRDGSLISYPDFGAGRLRWSLNYSGLSEVEAITLKSCFDACSGPLLPFTFIDPTNNALTWSSDLTNSVWQRSPLINIQAGMTDPMGSAGAFTIVNNGQSNQEITQTIPIPSNFQYCFSIYAASTQPDSLILIRRGAKAEDQYVASVGTGWTRIQSTGRLNDGGAALSVGLSLAPGQSIQIYGPQLEGQLQSSQYRPTGTMGGVFQTCFWTTEEIAIVADGPYSFSTRIDLETTL